MTTSAPSNVMPLPARLFLAGFITTLGHVGATQFFAHKLHYQTRFLGAPIRVDEAVGISYYLPYKVWVWSRTFYGGHIDSLIFKAMAIALFSSVFGLALLVVLGIDRSKLRDAHGSSRWATDKEIEAWGWTKTIKERIDTLRKKGGALRDTASVVIGMDKKERLFFNWGVEHLLAFAPTRSGKGIGLVIPTLLSWSQSVVVTDIKGENFQITAWWRSLFSHVIYLNPTDPNSACFNPLLEIRPGTNAIRDAMNLAEILASPAEGDDDPFWTGGAKKLLSATMLYVLYTQKDKSLARCAHHLMRLDELLKAMMEAHIADLEVKEYVQSIAISISKSPEKIRGGWAANADGALDLWKDPIVAKTTRTSDFRLRDLQYAKNPVSLFIVIPPNDLARLKPFVRLFFEQLTDTLTETLPMDKSHHRLLMLMDEFPQFGRMKKIEDSISITAGYDIKWFFIVQGIDQFNRIYGQDNAFLANCHTRLAYRTNDFKNGEFLSKLLGKTTGYKEQEGKSGKKGIVTFFNQGSVSMVEYERDLLTAGEAQQLDAERIVIMNAGMPPVLGHRVHFYKHPEFIAKFKGRAVEFPSEPLKDFPATTLENPWLLPGSSSAASREESEEEAQLKDSAAGEANTPSEGTPRDSLREEALPATSKLDSSPETKATAQEASAFADEVPPGTSSKDAVKHLTTRSLTTEALTDILLKGVKSGLLSQERFDLFLEGIEERQPAAHAKAEPVSDAKEKVASPRTEPHTSRTPSADALFDEEDEEQPEDPNTTIKLTEERLMDIITSQRASSWAPDLGEEE